MVSSRKPRVLVALHDVWPGNYASVDRELQWLRERGVAAPALFVVPCYHGQKPIDEDPAFLEWLRGQIAAGAALFAHGYRHLRAEHCGEKIRRSAWGKWVNRRVNHEGEFAGLSAADASGYLRQCFRHFRKADLDPTGLALPAWVGTIPVTFELPTFCRFVDGRFSVSDRNANRKIWAPPLTFGQTAPSAEPFLFGGAPWLGFLRRQKLLRIALHPGDLQHESVRGIVAEWLKKGEVISYPQAFS